jgi:UDP-glucose 4-epimerase
MENKRRTALVTGVSGYLGSHLSKKLKEQGFRVIGVDKQTPKHSFFYRFHRFDVLDFVALEEIFGSYEIDVVFHLAGMIEVGESWKHPTQFWENNVGGTVRVLAAMKRHGCENIIFSSTAGLYIDSSIPIVEHEVIVNNNPYANSKHACEMAIEDSGLEYVIFRYFNLAGSGGDVGEDHNPETHLIPRILQNLNSFEVYGDDYNTHDGTCIRDYVHVEDVVDAHIEAVKYLEEGNSSEIINLGAGVGYSVKEIIQTIEKVTLKKVNYTVSPRRKGDPESLVASIEKAKQLLNYSPKHDIASIIKSAFEWEKKRNRIR